LGKIPHQDALFFKEFISDFLLEYQSDAKQISQSIKIIEGRKATQEWIDSLFDNREKYADLFD